jgi:hypothetical protein
MTRWGVILLVSFIALGLNSRIPASKATTIGIVVTALVVMTVLAKTIA